MLDNGQLIQKGPVRRQSVRLLMWWSLSFLISSLSLTNFLMFHDGCQKFLNCTKLVTYEFSTWIINRIKYCTKFQQWNSFRSYPPHIPYHITNSYYSRLHHLTRLSRNKLIVTKHQSQQKQLQQHQINNPPTQFTVDDVQTISYHQQHHQSGDGSEDASDCLSDSTIEKMRLQVRMQREKVEDER